MPSITHSSTSVSNSLTIHQKGSTSMMQQSKTRLLLQLHAITKVMNFMDSKFNKHAAAVLVSKHVTRVKDFIILNLPFLRISTMALFLGFGEESSLSHQELLIIGIRETN